jgi:pilus assembly protein CpaF
MLSHTDGRARAVTVWHADRGSTDEVAGLHRLLQSRTPS